LSHSTGQSLLGSSAFFHRNSQVKYDSYEPSWRSNGSCAQRIWSTVPSSWTLMR
jgi:hypothetical protein